LLDSCEFAHPDPEGISERPAEVGADGRQYSLARPSATLNQLTIATPAAGCCDDVELAGWPGHDYFEADVLADVLDTLSVVAIIRA